MTEADNSYIVMDKNPFKQGNPCLWYFLCLNYIILYLCSISKDDRPDTTFLTQQQMEVPDLSVAKAWPEETPVGS